MHRRYASRLLSAALALLVALPAGANEATTPATTTPPGQVLIENVRVLHDGRLGAPSHVLVRGNTIARISTTPIAVDRRADTRIIDGGGRTLMPGLIDAHTHLMVKTIPQTALLTADIGFVNVAAVKAANDMLLRGFTSVRDLGGPVLGLKRGIDAGLVPGPRIWPSGAFVSQSGGHGDFRLPNEMPARPGDFSYSERVSAAVIADSPDAVRQRVREQLALGATQIKLMAGGGVSSHYDPLDATQYTTAELRAAVEAGVKCIDHGQMLDDATARLMAQKGVWWSLQAFIDDGRSPHAEGSPNRLKQLQMYQGTDNAFALAKKYRIKTAWGSDILFSAANAARQNSLLTRMTRWYTPAEVLTMATRQNAELLALSGERSPYPGRLGVVEEGALADLLLVDGNPLEDLALIEDPARRFLVIMKDGQLYKNQLADTAGTE